MEFYDTFSEDGIFRESVDEADVHFKGLWHKVIRIWLYDNEGNIYLRVRKNDNKLDCINELHLRSSESIVECFDRGVFEKLGVHFNATSNFEQAYMRKKKINKVYSDNTELRENYFLCDYLGEFQNTTSYYLFSDDTAGLIKVNARGINKIMEQRTGEIIGYEVKPFGEASLEKKFITIEDIYNNREENLFVKYNFVLNAIIKNSAQYEKQRREDEKIKQLIARSQTPSYGNYVSSGSHADDDEGNTLY